MSPDPAFHPFAAEALPRPPVEGGVGIGAPMDPFTGRGVKPMSGPCEPRTTQAYLEARSYNGVSGVVLSHHAADIWNTYHDEPCHPGCAVRSLARMSAVMAAAVWAFIVVKNALHVLALPLRPNAGAARKMSNRARRFGPKRKTIWLTPPPTQAAWKTRDAEAGYDIRGTSPTWVMRRVYRHRAHRRQVLETPLARAGRHAKRDAHLAASNAAFIGPPAPLHYKEVADIGLIWPPIAPPTLPKAHLPPVQAADFIPDDARAGLTPEDVCRADQLIDGHNYALEQFGEEGAFNYLQGLHPIERAFMDAYMTAHRSFIIKGGVKSRVNGGAASWINGRAPPT